MSLKKSVEAEIMSQIFDSQMKKDPDKWKILIVDRLTTLILLGMQLLKSKLVILLLSFRPEIGLTRETGSSLMSEKNVRNTPNCDI